MNKLLSYFSAAPGDYDMFCEFVRIWGLLSSGIDINQKAFIFSKGNKKGTDFALPSVVQFQGSGRESNK
jgi:hypothetical protein